MAIRNLRKGTVVSFNQKGFGLVRDEAGAEFLLFRGDHLWIGLEYWDRGPLTWSSQMTSLNSYLYKIEMGTLQLAVGVEVVFEAKTDPRGRQVVKTWEFEEAFQYFLKNKNIPCPEYYKGEPTAKDDKKYYLAVYSDCLPTAGHSGSCWDIVAEINGVTNTVTHTFFTSHFAGMNDGWIARTRYNRGDIDLYDALQTEGAVIVFESEYSKVTYQIMNGLVEEVSAVGKTEWGSGHPSIAWIPEGGDEDSLGGILPIEWFSSCPAKEVDYLGIKKIKIKSATLASQVGPNQGSIRGYSGAVGNIYEREVPEYTEIVKNQGITLEFSASGKLTYVEVGKLKFVRHNGGSFSLNPFTFKGLDEGKIEVGKSHLPTIYLGRKIAHSFKDIGEGKGTIFVPLRDVLFVSYE